MLLLTNPEPSGVLFLTHPAEHGWHLPLWYHSRPVGSH